MTSRFALTLFVLLGVSLGYSQAHAMAIDLLLESNDDSNGNEVFIANFDSYQSLLDGALSGGTFSDLNINSSFSSGGLAYDGNTYQLLLESNDDRNENEVFIASFDSYQDLLDGTLSAGSFSQLNINSSFSAGGLAYNGSSYQLLLESNDDRNDNEIFLASFDSYQDLLDGTLSGGSFSELNISATFSAGGLAYTGSSYQLLLESNDDRNGNEVFMATFDSFQDLLDGTLSGSSFSELNINPGFSAGGLVAYLPEPVEVPEPGTLGLLLIGLTTIWLRARRRI